MAVTGPDDLAGILLELERRSPAEPIDATGWLEADYSPLPSLVTAARRIFDNEPLPHIRRAESAGIPQTLAYLTAVAAQARAHGGLHLALVTGVPGSGKTLVGLQFVYQTHFGEWAGRQQAVFLSGNGPLVKVLQYALESRVFVQDVHGFLKSYGGSQRREPAEHIWVYDEAQRAWDAAQVQEKRGHPISEPEDFLRIGARKNWALMVGLIGEGQEIHVGEESGLVQWNEAIARMPEPWVVHCPDKISHVFRDATGVERSNLLDLSVSLRTHLAEDVQDWVASLLDGRLDEAAALAGRVRRQGFDLYLTGDRDEAEAYVRERYRGQEEARYGLMASSKAKLGDYGIYADFQSTKRLRVGPWFYDPPDKPL